MNKSLGDQIAEFSALIEIFREDTFCREMQLNQLKNEVLENRKLLLQLNEKLDQLLEKEVLENG